VARSLFAGPDDARLLDHQEALAARIGVPLPAAWSVLSPHSKSDAGFWRKALPVTTGGRSMAHPSEDSVVRGTACRARHLAHPAFAKQGGDLIRAEACAS